MSSVSQNLPSAIAPRFNEGTPSIAAYVSTMAVTGLNICATLGVSSILSRTWSKPDFLLFTTVNRYLSLLYCIVSLSLGYGIVKLYRTSGSEEQRANVLSNALLIVTALAFAIVVATQLFSHEIVAFFDSENIATRWAILAGCVWVIGQSAYHVVLSYERALGNTFAANLLMLLVKALLVLGLSLLAWSSQSMNVAEYYGWVGIAILGVLLGYLWNLRPTWRFSVDLHLCRKLSAISWSRCFESILKHAVMPIVVTLLYLADQPEAAGGIVVVAMLMRGIESLFQPLVLMVMADSIGTSTSLAAQRKRVQASWDCILVISVPATGFLVLLAEPLLAIWLGDSYRNLAPAFCFISFALPAVLATILLRGNLESQYQMSPLALTCLARIGLILLIFPMLNHWGMLSLNSAAVSIAALYWAQFVVIFWLLRKHFGTVIFSATFYHYCLKKLSNGGLQR